MVSPMIVTSTKASNNGTAFIFVSYCCCLAVFVFVFIFHTYISRFSVFFFSYSNTVWNEGTPIVCAYLTNEKSSRCGWYFCCCRHRRRHCHGNRLNFTIFSLFQRVHAKPLPFLRWSWKHPKNVLRFSFVKEKKKNIYLLQSAFFTCTTVVYFSFSFVFQGIEFVVIFVLLLFVFHSIIFFECQAIGFFLPFLSAYFVILKFYSY